MSELEPANPSAGGEPASDNPSARLEQAFSKTENEPTPAPKAEAATTPPDKAQPESGSVSTANGQSQDEKIPWNKDPRFQQFLKDQEEVKRKNEDLEKKAKEFTEKEHYYKQGMTWANALKQYPKLAERVNEAIQHLIAETNGEKPDDKPAPASPEEKEEQERVNAIAAKLLASAPFKEILGKVQVFEKTHKTLETERSEAEVNRRFTSVKEGYQPIFDDMTKDLKVPTRYKRVFEKNVWEKLYELSPDSVKNLTIDEPSFRKAVEHATQEFNELNNEFVSGFTKSLPAAPKPNGGRAAIQVQDASDEDAEKELVSQLKSLSAAAH